ncbi:hypothetical protein H2204_001457 [Knufia peltigerae]|uniref:Enoyl reductase (ER) domain-containing protein n=1 Tax=Knufia peltigerae TaxID=1002370 RepID=A0AA38YDC1_9EURO|nr:hypothetical protein H2204_001457 [Knufia peltigerae]
MKAVVACGDEAVLTKNRPKPKLRDDCVLVKVIAVALNPTDWKHLAGRLVPDGCLLGCDFAGYVEEVGKGVTKVYSKGDRVAGTVHGGHPSQPEDGAFAEYIVAKGDLCFQVPRELPFEKAATLPLGLATVMQGLYQKGLKMNLPDNPIKEDKALVLIYGGSTATGALGIQFARLSGYTVVTTCSETNFEYVKSLGADHVLDCYNESPDQIGRQIREFTEDKLRLAWDLVSSSESARACSEALSSDGTGCRYASFLANKSPRPEIVSVGTNMYTIWGESFRVGEQLEYPASREDFDWGRRFMASAEILISQGKLRPHREVAMPGGLAGVPDGLEKLKMGGVSAGKLVYRISDTP